MKHIAIDAREWGTSTGRYVEQLVHYLERIDSEHHYTILVYPKNMRDYKPNKPNFSVIATTHKEFTFGEQFGLKRQLERLQPDLVHFGMVQQPVLYTGKVVTTMHDLTTVRFRNPTKNRVAFTLKQLVYRWVNKRVARKSDAIIVPSLFVKDDVATYTRVNRGKITVTYEAADPMPAGSKPFGGLEGKSFIMYIGRPLPHKNLGRLLDAFILLKSQHPDLLLVLAGRKDAAYKIHEQRVKNEGIKDVIFTGYITDYQLRWMYEHCAVYVFPSLSEGFGLPGLEAMMHGAPVASSNATCLPELYGDAAAYFDPLSVADIATTIHKVITNQTLRETLIVAGKKQARTYSWKRMAEQTLAVYNSVLDED